MALSQLLAAPSLRALREFNERGQLSAEDAQQFDSGQAQRLIEKLKLTPPSSDVFSQFLQLILTCSGNENILPHLLKAGILPVFKQLWDVLHSEGVQTQFNFLCTLQGLCECPMAKVAAGELFLLRFCQDIHGNLPTLVRRGMLSCCNSLLQLSSENKDLIKQSDLNVRRFFDLLRDCGDYFLQLQIVEFLFRIRKILSNEQEFAKLFGNEKIATAFLSINTKEFTPSLQDLVLQYNTHLGDQQKVFSLNALTLALGKHHQEETWIHFGVARLTFVVDTASIDVPYSTLRTVKLARTKQSSELKLSLREIPDELAEVMAPEDQLIISLRGEDVAYFKAKISPVLANDNKAREKKHADEEQKGRKQAPKEKSSDRESRARKREAEREDAEPAKRQAIEPRPTSLDVRINLGETTATGFVGLDLGLKDQLKSGL